MKLLFFKGFLGALILVLLLSINLLPAESGSKTIKLEGKPDFAVPLGSSSNLELAMKEAGFDMGMLPPVAWSFEKETPVPSQLDFSHQLSQGGLLILQWLTDTDSNYVVYNEGTLLKSYSVNPSGTGNLTVRVRACTSDVEKIHVEYLNLSAIDVSQLDGLKELKARNNKLNGVVDLRQATNLDVCNILYNNWTVSNTDGPHSFKLYLSQVRDLQIMRSAVKDTLDLSTCSNLQFADIFENQITQLDLPSNTLAPNLTRVNANDNDIANDLDFSGFQLLADIRLEHNDLERIKVDNLPALTKIYARNNMLRDTIDLRASTNLDICHIFYNNYQTAGTNGPHTLKFYVSQVRDLQVMHNGIIDTLDLSTCTNMETVWINDNQLTSLNLPSSSQAPNLWRINANKNLIDNMQDFSGFSSLSEIYLDYNQIEKIKVDNLPSLTKIYARNNMLRDTLDFRASTNLVTCHVFYNNWVNVGTQGTHTLKVYLSDVQDLFIDRSGIIDTLDLSSCNSLVYARFMENNISYLKLPTNTTAPNLKTLYASNNNISQELNLSGFSQLTDIHLQYNDIPKLDVTGLTALKHIYARNNPIRDTIDLRSSTDLITCHIYYTNWSFVGTGGSHKLHFLLSDVQNLQIMRCNMDDTLDLSTCTSLSLLNCSDNQIPAVNLAPITTKLSINHASVYNNNFSSSEVDSFADLLFDHISASPTTTNGVLNIYGNVGSYSTATTNILDDLEVSPYFWTVNR